MARTNTKPRVATATTYEGGRAVELDAERALRRAVLSCLLWEDNFYESGQDVADRIRTLTMQMLSGGPEKVRMVSDLMVEARQKHHLRHAPLWLLAGIIDGPQPRLMYRELVPQVVQRADEMGELIAMYWKNGKRPLPRQLVKGLAETFPKFDAYQLAKYDRENSMVRVRDVMFLTHPSVGRSGFTRQARKLTQAPVVREGQLDTYSIAAYDLSEQEQVWAKLAEDKLESPDTWEVGLSRGDDKKETWERLLSERKLGAMATIRNLRNMEKVGVNRQLIVDRLNWIDSRSGILPYQFVTAARYAPNFEPEIEAAMLRCTEGLPKLSGRTVILVDVSGSMDVHLSTRGEMNRIDAACGLAILAREICEDVRVFAFSNECKAIAPRRGFALRDAISGSMPHGGTRLGAAVEHIQRAADADQTDRIIVFTDEQSADRVSAPGKLGKGYMVNVAPYQHSVNFGDWVGVSGFSEATMDFVREIETVV